jgi:hypothetical protein
MYPRISLPLEPTPKHEESTPPETSTPNGSAPKHFPMMGEILNGGHKHDEAAIQRAKHPENTNAYLVGGGIASLAAAVHLIQDAHVPASQIHIIESSSVPGGCMDGLEILMTARASAVVACLILAIYVSMISSAESRL